MLLWTHEVKLPLQTILPQQGALDDGTLLHPGGICGHFGGLQTTSPKRHRQTEQAPLSDVSSPCLTTLPSRMQLSGRKFK